MRTIFQSDNISKVTVITTVYGKGWALDKSTYIVSVSFVTVVIFYIWPVWSMLYHSRKKVAYLESSKLQIVQIWHIDHWPHFQKIYFWKVMVMDVNIYCCTDVYIGAPYQKKNNNNNNIGTCLEPLKLHMVKKSNLTTIVICC